MLLVHQKDTGTIDFKTFEQAENTAALATM
jgi:hypothetical protein